MVYKLNIVHNGEEQGNFLVGHRQYAKIPAQKGMLLQLINEKGELVTAPKTKMVGKDLWVILEGNEQRPEIIIENYAAVAPLKDPKALQSLKATFATEGATAPMPAETTSIEKPANNESIEKPQDTAAMQKPPQEERPTTPSKADARDAKLAKEVAAKHDEPSGSNEASDADSDGGLFDSNVFSSTGAYIALGAVALGAGVVALKDDDDDNDSKSSLNEIKGDEQDNALEGTDKADAIAGLEGNDMIDGKAGDDKIDGGAGNDTLKGDAGNDMLKGGEGDDTLIGGTGADKLAGGAGNDKFVFNVPLDDAVDQILDFKVGDVLQLEDEIFADKSALAYDDATGTLSYDGNAFVTFNSPADFDLSVVSNIEMI